MNKLLLVKFIVFLLTGLLAIGFCLLFHKIAKKNSKSNLKQEQNLSYTKKESFFSIPENETIQNVFACQNLLCISITENEKISKIYMIQPNTGKTLHTLTFQSLAPEEK